MSVGDRIPLHEDHMHEDHNHHMHNESPSLEKEYGKLAVVIVAILAVTALVFLAFDGHGPYQNISEGQAFLTQFMGVFFIVFASFKLVNLESFASGFAMYDLIAKRSIVYAKLYPFLQLIIGLGMFVIPSTPLIHGAAVLLSVVALVGVVNSVRNKRQIHCACLGNVIKMPLATVSAIEDGSMFIISAYMFVMMLG